MSLISPAMMMISEKQSMNNTKITATNLALVFPHQETLHLLLELIATSLSAVCMYYILMFMYVNNSSQQ